MWPTGLSCHYKSHDFRLIRHSGWVYLARHITRPYYMVGCFVSFGRTNRPRTNYPQTNYLRPNHLDRITPYESPQTKTPNEYPDERQNENIGTIRRSHQTERISSACCVFSTETNTGVRQLPESKRQNGTNGRVPSQTIKGGLAERPQNSLSGLQERLLRIPQETKETSGTLGSKATVRTGSWTKRSFLPTENTNFLS